MFRASEKAIELLIAAQRECEEMYLSAQEPEIRVISAAPQEDLGDQ